MFYSRSENDGISTTKNFRLPLVFRVCIVLYYIIIIHARESLNIVRTFHRN